MMNFLVLTFGIAVGVTLSMVITTVLMFTVLSNPKVMTWLMKYYMNMFEKTFNALEELDKKDA